MSRTYGQVVYDASGPEGRPVWEIEAEPHVTLRLKRIFPRVSIHRRALRVADTPEIAADLTWILDRWPMVMDDLTAQRLRDQERHYVEQRDAVTKILDGHVLPLPMHDPALEPREYQLAAAHIVRATGRLLLTDELGLGKTFTSLLLLCDPESLPALVVTQPHLATQWRDELAKGFPWLTGHIAKQRDPYDVGNPDVLIVPYSKLGWWDQHLAGQVRTVIFDEAQELRRDGTQKYNAAVHVATEARLRMGLTATPVYNYGGEIYNVVSVLDAEALGTREEFTREWGKPSSFPLKVSDPTALGSYLREEGLMLGRTRKEVGRELPDVVRVVHSIELDEAKLDAETVDAVALAEKILARAGTNEELWRAAGDLDWRLRHATGVAKAKYVSQFVHMLLETEEPVVLWGWHRDVYEIWSGDLFRHRPVFYTGEESPAQKDRAKRDFLSGETNLLIMSLRSGAGLDGLQERSHVGVFGELDWSPGVHEQCIGRLRRDGMGDDPVVAYFLVADSGSDPAVAEVLNLKRQESESIMRPDRPDVLEVAGSDQDRVRLLAEQFLARQKARAS